MSDCAVDSSVMAKWVFPEVDSAQAVRVITDTLGRGDNLIVLEMVMAEAANAISVSSKSAYSEDKEAPNAIRRSHISERCVQAGRCR